MARKAINDLLAENLRHYMVEREFTSQQALAKKVGVVQRTIGYYLDPSKRKAGKSGKAASAKLSEVEKLAAVLRVEIWQLLMPAEKREHFAALEDAFKAFSKAMTTEAAPPQALKPAANEKRKAAALKLSARIYPFPVRPAPTS